MSAKGIIAFVAGAALGSGATYYILNKKMDAKYSELVEEEKRSIKESYENRLQKEIREINQNAMDTAEKALKNRNKPDLMDISVDYMEKVENAVNSGDYIDESIIYDLPVGSNDIYQITYEDYSNIANGYEKQYVQYFEDRVLADDMDEIIDIYSTVGSSSNLDASFAKAADDVIYYRNEALNTEYEIQKIYKSYYAAVGRLPY